jgi:hypothetical protein
MGQKEPFGSLWGYAANTSETFRTVSRRRILRSSQHLATLMQPQEWVRWGMRLVAYYAKVNVTSRPAKP